MEELNGNKKIRLLKVVVQPFFVSDDGENLTEIVCDPIVVSAAEWPTYPTTKFIEAFNNLSKTRV